MKSVRLGKVPLEISQTILDSARTFTEGLPRQNLGASISWSRPRMLMSRAATEADRLISSGNRRSICRRNGLFFGKFAEPELTRRRSRGRWAVTRAKDARSRLRWRPWTVTEKAGWPRLEISGPSATRSWHYCLGDNAREKGESENDGRGPE